MKKRKTKKKGLQVTEKEKERRKTANKEGSNDV
jgi:hypothetical protein